MYYCEQLTKEAKYIDLILLQVNSDKICFIDHIYNRLRYQNYIGPDDDELFNSSPYALFADIYFSPDFNEMNNTVGTLKYEPHKHFNLNSFEDVNAAYCHWFFTIFTGNYKRK